MLGETAGLLSPTRYVNERPGVHRRPAAGRRLRLDGLDPARLRRRRRTRSRPPTAALAAHGCPQPHTLWITETGVGAAPRDLSAADAISDAVAGCRALHDRLVQWWNDPRVTVAFQYTVREDDRFPTGLVSSDLTTMRRRSPSGPPGAAAAEPTAPPPPIARARSGSAKEAWASQRRRFAPLIGFRCVSADRLVLQLTVV